MNEVIDNTQETTTRSGDTIQKTTESKHINNEQGDKTIR